MARQPKQIHQCKECDTELSTKRQFCDDRCEQMNLCKSVRTATYRNRYAVKTFQEMIRAEAAAQPSGTVFAIVNSILRPVHRVFGECVCVTCGLVGPWQGGVGFRQMQTGHFCSRKDQSVLFHELNVSVQCSRCNQPPGSPNEFRLWMEMVRPADTIAHLETLAREPHSFTPDQLVTMRLEYSARLKAAVAKMKGSK